MALKGSFTSPYEYPLTEDAELDSSSTIYATTNNCSQTHFFTGSGYTGQYIVSSTSTYTDNTIYVSGSGYSNIAVYPPYVNYNPYPDGLMEMATEIAERCGKDVEAILSRLVTNLKHKLLEIT